MTPFSRKVLHLGVIVAAVFQRVWQTIELLFRSKAQVARRATGRFEALKRKEKGTEAEDLERNLLFL